MLDRTLYLDRVGAFVLDRLACLRNDYAKNECTLCQDVCAHHAFVFEQGKLRLTSLCVACGACMGSCPSKAFSLYGFAVDNTKHLLLKEGESVFTCKEHLPCLGALSVDAWSALLLDASNGFTCNLFECATCAHNHEDSVYHAIVKRLDEANRFVQALGLPQRIRTIKQALATPSRRVFFERLLKLKAQDYTAPTTPLFSLKQTLKQRLDATKIVSEAFSFIHVKRISKACDNCKECVQFCPTNALSYHQDQTKILFQMGKCIGCGICEDICHKEAISSVETSYDIVAFAYDKAEVLIAHDLRVCQTCKCAFSYKGREMICERCGCFEKEHAEMFLLASQSH